MNVQCVNLDILCGKNKAHILLINSTFCETCSHAQLRFLCNKTAPETERGQNM